MTTDLWETCTTVFFPRRLKIRSQKTRRQYQYALNDFGRHLGRQPTIDDLDDDVFIVWLGDMLNRGENADDPRSVETAISKAKRVLSLWRWLASRRVVDRFPTVELPQAPEPVPISLDEDQLRRLFEAARCRPGMIAGIPARYWWPGLFGFVFSTSERRGGTLATRWEWIDFMRKTAVIPAASRKGKMKSGIYPLWDEVLLLLSRIREPKRDLVFPWDRSETTYFKHYGKILEDAGLPNDRRHKTQCLRVTHNTWTKVMTGQHSPLLQHGSSQTSERHYEDKRFTAREPTKLFIPWDSPATLDSSAVIQLTEYASESEMALLPRAVLYRG